jgi:hypothetical protein
VSQPKKFQIFPQIGILPLSSSTAVVFRRMVTSTAGRTG